MRMHALQIQAASGSSYPSSARTNTVSSIDEHVQSSEGCCEVKVCQRTPALLHIMGHAFADGSNGFHTSQ